MSIKHKIKFKNLVAKELKTPKYKSKEVEDKTKYNRKNKTIWINADEEYAKHLTKFFKGEVE